MGWKGANQLGWKARPVFEKGSSSRLVSRPEALVVGARPVKLDNPPTVDLALPLTLGPTTVMAMTSKPTTMSTQSTTNLVPALRATAAPAIVQVSLACSNISDST